MDPGRPFPQFFRPFDYAADRSSFPSCSTVPDRNTGVPRGVSPPPQGGGRESNRTFPHPGDSSFLPFAQPAPAPVNAGGQTVPAFQPHFGPSQGGGRESNRTFPHPGHPLAGDGLRPNGLAFSHTPLGASPQGMGSWFPGSASTAGSFSAPRPSIPGVGPLFPSSSLDVYSGSDLAQPSWGRSGAPVWNGNATGLPTSSPAVCSGSGIVRDHSSPSPLFWQPAGPTLVADSSSLGFPALVSTVAPPSATIYRSSSASASTRSVTLPALPVSRSACAPLLSTSFLPTTDVRADHSSLTSASTSVAFPALPVSRPAYAPHLATSFLPATDFRAGISSFDSTACAFPRFSHVPLPSSILHTDASPSTLPRISAGSSSLTSRPVSAFRPAASPAFPDDSATGPTSDGEDQSVRSDPLLDPGSLPSLLATLEKVDPSLVVARTKHSDILTDAEALSRAARPADKELLLAQSPLLETFIKSICKEVRGFDACDAASSSKPSDPLLLGPRPLKSGQFLGVHRKRLRPFPKPAPPIAYTSLPDSSLKLTDTEKGLLPSHEGKSSPALVATLPDKVLSEWEEMHRLALESASMAERFIDVLFKDTQDALPEGSSLSQEQAAALLLASSSCLKSTLHSLSRSYINTILARRDALLAKAKARIPSAEKDSLRSLPLDPAGLLGPTALLSPALKPPSESNAALLEVAKALKSASPHKPPPSRQRQFTPARKRVHSSSSKDDSRKDRAPPPKRYKKSFPSKRNSSNPKPSSSKSAVSPP